MSNVISSGDEYGSVKIQKMAFGFYVGVPPMRIDYDKKFFNGKNAFENIAELQRQICDAKADDIEVYLTNSVRYGKTFVFLLGCLLVLSMQHGKNIRLYFPNGHLKRHFSAMGIMDFYRFNRKNSNTFFRLDKLSDVVTLVEQNLRDAPIQITEKLNEVLVSLIGEVYNNASEHSEAKYVMGGCYKKHGKKKMCFSCYDTGIGVVGSVKKMLEATGSKYVYDYEINRRLLRWALGKGNSTKPPPRGVGLDWLLDFAKLNHGRVTMCSDNVLFVQDPLGKQNFSELSSRFLGTFFEMEIVEDPNVLYKLKGELT